MSEPYIAEVCIWGCNFAPRGWAFCDGQLLPISSNTALFSLIGTTYGGDGRTTTALPNLSGDTQNELRAPMHPGRGPGLTSRRLGERTGTPTVTLSEAQIPGHTHIAKTYTSKGDSQVGTNTKIFSVRKAPAGNRLLNYKASDANDVQMAAGALSTTGGGQAHENRQPYLALNFCIALVGVFPSRS